MTTLPCVPLAQQKAQHALAASSARAVQAVAYSPHMEAAGPKLRIFVDADACPVKDEVYRVAARRW